MAMQVPRHIYAVRHCERIDEANEVWYYNSRFGRDNPPLSKRGMQQAEELKTEFKNVYFDHCFSSPYERCVQTMAKILEGRPNATINIEPGFLEAGFHYQENGAKEHSYQVAKQLAERYYNTINLNYKPLFLAPNKDEFDQRNGALCCTPRVTHTMERILKLCTGDILIVSHKHPLAIIQKFLIGNDTELRYPASGTVSKYEEQPSSYVGDRSRFIAAYLCDCSHISDKANLRGYKTSRRN